MSPWLQCLLFYGSQGSSLHAPEAPTTRPAALDLGSARSIQQTLSRFGAHAVACGKHSNWVWRSPAGQGCHPSGVQSTQSPTGPPRGCLAHSWAWGVGGAPRSSGESSPHPIRLHGWVMGALLLPPSSTLSSATPDPGPLPSKHLEAPSMLNPSWVRGDTGCSSHPTAHMEPGLAQGLVDWDASWFQAPPPEATWLELNKPGGCPSSDRRQLGAVGKGGSLLCTLLCAEALLVPLGPV